MVLSNKCFFSTLILLIVNKLIIISEQFDALERPNNGRINKKSYPLDFY